MSTQLGLLKHIPCPRGEACTAYRCLFRHAGDDDRWPLPGVQDPSAQPLDSPSTHDPSAQVESATLSLTTGGAADQQADQADPVQTAPRKRVKLGDGEYDPTSPPMPLGLCLGSHDAEEFAGQTNKVTSSSEPAVSSAETALQTDAISSLRKRPISPPPLKRKATEAPAKTALPKPASGSRRAAATALAVPQNFSTERVLDSPRPTSSFGGSSTISTAANNNNNHSNKTSNHASVPTASEATTVSTRKAETLNPRHLGKAPATHDIRFKLVKMLHAEFFRLNSELRTNGSEDDKKKLLMSAQELVWLTLDMEENCAVSKPAIYSNTIKNRIMSYKRMSLAQWTKERTDIREKDLRKQQSVERIAQGQMQQGTGSSRDTGKDTAEPVVLETGLTSAEEVAFLKENLLTPIQSLANHGYVPAVLLEAEIQKAREAAEVSKGWELCDRCGTRFQVFPGRREEDGALTSGGSCTHHPGKAFFPPKAAMAGSGARDNTKRFRCCGQAVGDSAGCVTTTSHVFKTSDPKRLALLWNFTQTPPNPSVPSDRAVCFDCEMGYTVYGMELIRVTATSWPDGERLLDVLVRPIGEIIDLNSRYSGVWPEDMAKALPFSAATVFDNSKSEQEEEGRRQLQIVSSPVVARDLLYALISPETPLVGHGLENDLNSMRIVHPTICDTILLFPHPKGLPVRYGLKMLVDRHLHRQIQVEPQGDSGVLMGHDSAEDARAAGDLVRFKVKQEWASKRTDGWAFMDGHLVAPGTRPGKGSSGVLTEAYIEKGKG